jgi:hypothetical protein
LNLNILKKWKKISDTSTEGYVTKLKKDNAMGFRGFSPNFALSVVDLQY